MVDSLDALGGIGKALDALDRIATARKGTRLRASVAGPVCRAIAMTYYKEVRSHLLTVATRSGLVEEIEWCINGLLSLATATREREPYIGHINELRPYLLEATIDMMKSQGEPRLVLSPTERAILDTLAKMLPTTSRAYEQVLWDVTAGARVSWRGTCAELRETLREVIDYLAPDEKVSAATGFQREAGQTGPTQKQKVRFILQARRDSGAIGMVEESLALVDEAVGALARQAYSRTSAGVHAHAHGSDVKNLKRYVEAVLAQLLEVAG